MSSSQMNAVQYQMSATSLNQNGEPEITGDIGRHQELIVWLQVGHHETGSRNNLYPGMSGVG